MVSLLNFIHWNPDPEILRIGSFAVRWYGLLFASGFLIGYYIGERMFRSENVSSRWIDSLFFYIIIATVVGARLGHVIFYGWEYYSKHPLEIFMTWHGGLASHGGAIGILVALWIHSRLVTRRTMLWSLDRVVVPTALVGAFIRAGNLMNSEIYGIQTSLPWGFIFERNGETLPKHPTQIYEALCYLLSFFLLLWFYRRGDYKNRPGFLMGLFFILIFTARFFIEFIKEDQEAFEAGMLLNMGQLLSIPCILAGIFLVWRAMAKPVVHFKNQ